MAELLTSLPGDIPGLLRRGSPVAFLPVPVVSASSNGTARGVVIDVTDPTPVYVLWWPLARLEPQPAPYLALDLTDPTGRWHAACWVRAQLPATHILRALTPDECCLLADIGRNVPMTPTEIDTLAHLVLRLAGRAP